MRKVIAFDVFYGIATVQAVSQTFYPGTFHQYVSFHGGSGIRVMVVDSTALYIPHRIDTVNTLITGEFLQSTAIGTFGTTVRAQTDGLVEVVHAGSGIVVVGVVYLSA